MKGTPKLAAPPIVEAVCGLIFAPIPDLDPIVLGKFWHDLRADYPQHLVQPPVIDQVGLMLSPGAGPLRSWFISSNDEYLIQLQHDRFYMNWRKREAGYPRFNDYDDQKGVMSRALGEFERFAQFCEEALGVRPVLTRAEVAKVDLLLRGTHWQDAADLAKLMPVMVALRGHSAGDDPDVALRIGERRAQGDFVLSLHLGIQSIFGMMPSYGLRLETRAHRAIDGSKIDLRQELGALNGMVNDAFFGLFEPSELTRFEKVT